MLRLKIWLLPLVLGTFVYGGTDWTRDFKEYCIDGHDDNTPCLTGCKIGENCSVMLSDFDNPMTNRERQYVLDLHNVMRERIARGDYMAANFPPATNMLALNYDEECEFMTTCWIRQCNFWHDVHFQVNGSRQGQNLHKKGTSGTFKRYGDSFMEFGLTSWFKEYQLLIDHPQIVHGWYKVEGAGHFTALIWAKTQVVGCAKTLFKGPGGQEYFFLYCNYFPNANIKGAKIYDTMPHTCTRNKRYPHLCGQVKNLVAEPVYNEEEHARKNSGRNWHLAMWHWSIYIILFIFLLHHDI